MHRFLSAALLTLSLTCFVTVPAGPAAALGPGEFHVFVWKVSHPEQVGADYLAGTIHLPVSAKLRVPARVRTWIKDASRFVMEVDLAQTTPDLIQRYALMAEDQRLDQLLPPSAWRKLLATTHPMGMPPEQLSRMQPWVLNLALTYPTAPPDRVVDTVLKSQARLALVPVSYLEQPEEQMQALDAVAMDEDVRQLLETLDDPKKAEQQLATMGRAYFKGDLETLERLVFDPEQMRRYPDFYDKLFHERNARWLPKLQAVLEKDDAFVAVGLGHLVGDRGILKQLEAAGYTIERIKL